jgi:hypothetical protein
MTTSIGIDETWHRMLNKAITENIIARRVGPTEFKVSSSSGDKVYDVTVVGKVAHCTCMASRGYCKHRALVLFKLGLLGNTEEEEIESLPTERSEDDPTPDELEAWFGSD